MTQEQNAKADELLKTGMKAMEIAEVVGVNKQQIYDYKHDKKKEEQKSAVTPEKRAGQCPAPTRQAEAAPVNDKVMALQLIRDMLDTVRKLYGIE